MYLNSKTAKSVRLALALGAASAAVFTANVSAQEEAAEESSVEKISVTGSRLRQTDLESAVPITTISRDDILATGLTDVGDLIQRMPAMSGSPIGTTTNNGGTGAVQVNLRGLGSNRTLVLVNGRRVVEGNDFQTIPLAMIDRVDILKDGASAVYGADAVAGVVNIITRDDFEGVQVEVQRSGMFDVDAGDETTVSLIAGSNWDRGSLVVGFEYTEQDEVYQGDVTENPYFQDSFWITEASATGDLCFVNCGTGPYHDTDGVIFPNNSSTPTVIGIGSSRIPGSNMNFNANSQYAGGSWTLDPAFWGGSGITTPDQWRAYNGSTFDPNNDSYNYAPVNFLQTPFERLNIFIEGKFEVARDHEFYFMSRVNRRESEQELAPVPYDTAFDPGYQVNVLDADGNVIGTANGISGQNVYNPFGEDIIRSRRRMVEAPRRFTQDVLQAQTYMGMQGVLTDSWTYDVSYNYGYLQITSNDYGQYAASRLSAALGPSYYDENGVAQCGTDSDNPHPDAACVPLNLFGGPGTVTQEMLDYVSAPLNDSGRGGMQIFNATFAGDIMELPAGALAGAFGLEYRDQEITAVNDSAKYVGEVTGNKGAGTSGSYNVSSLFGEVGIPILSDDMSLNAELGFRYDDYSTFGTNTTFQGKVRFEPLDGLLIRGTVGQVFREPNIQELFLPQGDSFPQYNGPCNTNNFAGLTADQQARCTAQGVPAGGWVQTDSQALARVGGNPNVAPEEGDTWTVGVAYSPDFLEGFTITLDFWETELESVISTLGAQQIANKCILEGITSLCDNISRTATGGIQGISDVVDNLASRTVGGTDVELDYRFEVADMGELDFNLLWTILGTYDEIPAPGEPVEDKIGIMDFNTGEVRAKHKANFAIDWFYEDFAFSYLLEYIDGIESATSLWGDDYIQQVDSQVYHDIAGSYTFDFGTKVSMGIRNITDEAAPFIDAGFNASTDPSTYRMFGRTWDIRLTHKF